MVSGRNQGRSLLSPLRYPGGKRKLAAYIAATIRLNGLRPRLFVEPFAGGASVSLYLLEQGLVEKIALGEKDELVAAFWQTVFFDHEWLVEQLREIKPTLELWTEFRRSDPQDNREKALKCLFLNRTSFSGILNKTAGPLGGQKQASEYRLDCRFYPNTVIQRIQTLACLSGRVQFIHCGDWRETIDLAAKTQPQKSEIFYYLDPPFYQKADRLYRYWFNDSDHRNLHGEISCLDSFYLLSYDAAPAIIEMYCHNGSKAHTVELLYSMTANTKRIAKELIISNLPFLPGN